MDKAISDDKGQPDADIRAVRALMAQTETSEADASCEPPQHLRKRETLAGPATEAEVFAVPGPTPRSAVLKDHAKALATALFARAKAYRPHRASVLLTSFLLLLVLQPGLMFGAAFVILAVVLGSYLALGGEGFWRYVVTIHGTWTKMHPASARRMKVRAYIFARKWRMLVSKLPKALADRLQLPDVRYLMAADERHDAALHERLSRLR